MSKAPVLLCRSSDLASQASQEARQRGGNRPRKTPRASGYTGGFMPMAHSPKPGLRVLWDWPGPLPAATAQSLCRAKETKQSLI